MPTGIRTPPTPDSTPRQIRAEGWRGAALRIEAEPEQLGRLLGRNGMFASRSAQMDRARASAAALSLGHNLSRIAEAEQWAERDYRASVTAQIARDKVGVPKLSAEAMTALETVRAASSREQPGRSQHQAESRNRPAVARAWEQGPA